MISVIIPYYNPDQNIATEKLLKRAIRSACDSLDGVAAYEILIVNDGSPGDPVLDEFEGKPLIYIRREHNMFSALASALIWVPTVILLSRIQDDAFYNSARFAARFALSPISFILWIVLYFTFLPWQFALACLLLSIPSLRYLYDYGSFARRVLSDLRWKFRKHKAPDYKDLF
jgi:glycosyltransferase involved in cell wall biosynthesis